MQYMLLLYENEEIYGGRKKDGPALKAVAARHWEFVEELGPVRVAGGGLAGTAFATTVRTKGGRQVVHDGPFAETKEQFGGYYIIDVPDIAAAIELARKVPLTADGSVEIRPLLAPPPSAGS